MKWFDIYSDLQTEIEMEIRIRNRVGNRGSLMDVEVYSI